MGIHQLTKVIGDHAPKAIKNADLKSFFGRKVAIDASMSIYQFLIAVRQEGNTLINQEGESTSHLMGMFYRTVRMVENGLKPVYVFEGKPPDLKSGELQKRSERREDSEKQLNKAEEVGDTEAVEKFSRRLVRVTPQHNEECMQLLRLMGIPVVEAPGEAEAQCAALAKAGKVYAVGTEDMDALVFGTPVLLRHLTFSEARKLPIMELRLQPILDGLSFSMDQFIDACILLGCDYCETIRGIGPKKAIDLIQRHGSLESAISHLDTSKYPLPQDWLYKEAKQLFLQPEITDPELIEIKWTDPDEEGLVEFLCIKNGFKEERIRNAVKRLLKSRSGTTQVRIDNFFAVTPSSPKKDKITTEHDVKSNGKRAPVTKKKKTSKKQRC